MKTAYKDIFIVYDETENKWKFAFRGRERSVGSLKEAKEIIDRPVKAEKPAFDRIEAYHKTSYGPFERVTITSVAATVGWRYGEKEVWITKYGGKEREKVSVSDLYPVNPGTDAAIAQYTDYTAQIRKLEKLKETLVSGLKPLVVK